MNYVFFYPDEMRAGALSCYGNPGVQMPNYDRLAREGTVFEQNYTAHPVCVASRCSLMTGWYPHVAGFRTLKNFLRPEHPNFLKILHDAGFEIHLYGKNHIFSEEVYFDCVDKYLYADFGHGHVKAVRGNVPEADRTYKSTEEVWEASDYSMLLPALPDDALEGLHDTRCVRAAVDALRAWKPGDKPLFLFLPTLYPHAPYRITRQFQELYDPAALSPVLPPDLPGKPALHGLIRQYRGLEGRDESLFQKIKAVYCGMCSYSDMLLGRILDALDETGLRADTTVIASSDHGEWAGDWGLIEKWPSGMDDDLTRVPLLISRPGCPGGHRVKELTQTFDIFPTVCQWENINIRHDQFGLSLACEVAGGEGDPRRAVYCEGGYDVREPHCFEGTKAFSVYCKPGTLYYPKMVQQQQHPASVCRTVMRRDARYKLVERTDGDNELYDMESDPQELCNLFGQPGQEAVTARLRSELLTWLIGTSDTVPWEGHVEAE